MYFLKFLVKTFRKIINVFESANAFEFQWGENESGIARSTLRIAYTSSWEIRWTSHFECFNVDEFFIQQSQRPCKKWYHRGKGRYL